MYSVITQPLLFSRIVILIVASFNLKGALWECPVHDIYPAILKKVDHCGYE